MSRLEANLKLIRERFPRLYPALQKAPEAESFNVTQTLNGESTLTVNGIQIHSRYRPIEESRRILDRQIHPENRIRFFLGMGLGYLPQLRASALSPESDEMLIVVEPDIRLLKSTLAAVDLSTLLSFPNLIILTSCSPDALLEAAAIAATPNFDLITTESLQQGREGWFMEATSALNRFRESWQVNLNTHREFGGTWKRQTFSSLARLKETPTPILPVSRLFGAFHRLPALIAAAGPGLDDSVELLKEYSEKGLLIAVDTALTFLQKRGIKPHFAVISDSQYWNSRHLDRVNLKGIAVITELTVHPSLFSRECTAFFLYSSRIPICRAVEELTGEMGALGTGGSVATTAWDFARCAQASPITAAGLDLGYPAGRTHCSGGRFEQRLQSFSRKLFPSDLFNMNLLFGELSAEAMSDSGNPIRSDRRMLIYRDWFEQQIERYPGDYRRSDPEGTAISGMQNQYRSPLRDSEAERPDQNSVDEILASLTRGASTLDFKNIRKRFAQRLQKAADEMRREQFRLSGPALLHSPFMSFLKMECFSILENPNSSLNEKIRAVTTVVEELSEGI